MNFLAHLHLADATADSRVGNLLGDFVTGLPWDDRFSEALWCGIMEHRHLDAWNDGHPLWQRSRDRLQGAARRYAGIVIDIFYDYFLVRHWDRFNPDQGLESFVSDVHADLEAGLSAMPESAAEAVRRLLDEGWLLSYGEIDGIRAAIDRVAYSHPRLAQVRGLEAELVAYESEFEADFLAFYPEAIARAVEIRREIVEKRKSSSL